MSASDTGDDAPLVQFFNSVRNNDSASAPASRTVAASNAESRCKIPARAGSIVAHRVGASVRQPSTLRCAASVH